MAAHETVADTRSVGHLFEFHTLEINVAPHHLDEVIRAAEDVARYARCHERGTRLFAMLRDREQPGRLLCTAVFDDEEAARRHRAGPAATHLAALLLSIGAETRAAAWSAVAGI